MIVVEPYNVVWPQWFGVLQARLAPFLEGIDHQIEHVGSTSVPGLAAKPIIDMDIIVAAGGLERAIAAVVSAGYTHRGELGIVGRHAFGNPDGEPLPAHHLYVCVEGADSLRNHLVLRDHLRANPDAVRRYGALKMRLARVHVDDIDAYVEGKTDFILGVLQGAGMSLGSLDDIRQANKAP